jgi:phage baseplate assembly protein W
MIPTTTATTDDLTNDFDVLTEVMQPTKTYYMQLEIIRVQGLTDGQAAMKQAIFKILQTERYQYPVYSDNYGVELRELIGQPIPYVLPEIDRRITEALTWDERITNVTDFVFDVKKSKVHTTYKVHTIFGEVEIEVAVNI